jgi:hypothetical protein
MNIVPSKKSKTSDPSKSPNHVSLAQLGVSEEETPEPNTSVSRRPVGFLDLPKAIRSQIYQCFMEHHTRDDSIKKIETVVARRSLLAVCHQLTDECVPLFYGKATIKVHGMATDTSAWSQITPYDAVRAFETHFLNTLSPAKLFNIRRLEWLVNCNTTFDHKAAMKSVKILNNHRGIMRSLSFLKIYGRCHWPISEHDGDDMENAKPDIKGANPYHDSDSVLWAEANKEEAYEVVVTTLRGEGADSQDHLAMLKGWSVRKNLVIHLTDDVVGFDAQGISVTFRKPAVLTDVNPKCNLAVECFPLRNLD